MSADATGPQPALDRHVTAADVATALSGYFSREQIAELRAGAGTLQINALGSGRDDTPWARLGAVLDLLLMPTGDDDQAAGSQPPVRIVNDMGAVGGPFVLYPNAAREGSPVEVLLEHSGQRVTVVEPGQRFSIVPGSAAGLAQRLYMTPVQSVG